MAQRVKVATATADGTIKSGKATYYGCRVIGDGTNAAQVIIYDNTSASGAVIDAARCPATDSVGGPFPVGVTCYNGIYVDVTTVGRVMVWYT